ncbi:MAG: HDIG domain-containing protein [Armatimonadetes bacterium]|nr:HDIG domain-containing protein [Armatimonadota bacterium]MDW8027831.1 HDIG domain-containing protein [Armatimonadota bacterium]
MANDPSGEKIRKTRSKRIRNGNKFRNMMAILSDHIQGLGFSLKVSATKLGLFCILLISLFLAMTPPSFLVPVPFVVGQTFPHDIRAHRTVRYLSEIETEKRMQMVAQAVPKQYRLDETVTSQWRAILNELTDSVIAMQNEPRTTSEKIKIIRERIGLNVPYRTLSTMLKTSPATVRFGHEILLQALESEWQRGVKPIPEEREEALLRVKAKIDKLPLSTELKSALKQLSELALQPNMVFDPEATQMARNEAKANVEPVWKTIVAGELIARKGELVTEEHLEKLRALGYNLPALMGIAFLAFLLSGVTFLFIKMVLPSNLATEPRLALLALLWSLGLILVRFLFRSLGQEIAFVAVSTLTMVTTVLFNPFISIFLSGIFALTTTLGMTMDWQTLPSSALRPFITSAGIGMAASFLSADAKTRANLVRVGFLLSLLVFTVELTLGLITGETLTISWSDFQQLLLWSILVGSISPALTMVIVSVLERPFKITTVFTLAELSNPNSPLLRELAEKAPGTFQSSLMVARLAQEAAKHIGANELLAWVGGLYHDIGKLFNPQYFVENLPYGSNNPHDKLGPHLSAIILQQHVKKGEELARKFGLPEPVIEIIREHHGTSLMTFFWHKAKDQGQIVDHDFRYEGPKPKSKESAIVMLADSVEAAVRALPNPNPAEIEEVIDKVITSKLEDGQLEESPMSFRDLMETKRAFLETFKSIFHRRIEYPTREREANGAQIIRAGHQNHQTVYNERVEKETKASG